MSGLMIAAETLGTLLEYLLYGAIIVVGLILLAATRRKTKKEVTSGWVKNRCERAKKYAVKLIAEGEKSGLSVWLGSTKLMKLNDKLTDAAWAAYQIVEVKKDVVFEGIALTLDKLADGLSQETQNGYVSAEDFEKDVKKIIEGLDKAIEKIQKTAA